jgi:phosphoribosyl 1,2-cyclic phosphodiesterase/ActR/RegA family two-component response regulator
MSPSGPFKTALLIEGDPLFREAASQVLKEMGLELRAIPPGERALKEMIAARPDLLLLDGDLPEMAGLRWLADIKRRDELAAARVIVLSSDRSPEERRRAFELGADEFVAKPCTPATLAEILESLDRFEPAFWGIRGTLPIPGAATLKYGGNTSCISLAIGYGRHFIFDAGTGLRTLSNRIMETTGGRFDGRLFISHPHWDHFNSLPFFQPLYTPGNHIVIHGPAQGERSLRDLIDDQMDGIFFPITVEEFEATVEYQDIAEGVHHFDGVQITAKRLQHPGHCLAYRVDHHGRSFAYVTDNELGTRPPDDPAVRGLVEFLRGVDVLIHDCTYFDDEYPKKVNWGHSSIGQATRLAHAAGARYFYLFHHDPDHGDVDVERKLETARRLLAELGSSTRCRIAVEGDSVRIDALPG